MTETPKDQRDRSNVDPSVKLPLRIQIEYEDDGSTETLKVVDMWREGRFQLMEAITPNGDVKVFQRRIDN